MHNPLYGKPIEELPEGECPADVCPFQVEGAQYPNSCTECATSLSYTAYEAAGEDEQTAVCSQCGGVSEWLPEREECPFCLWHPQA